MLSVKVPPTSEATRTAAFMPYYDSSFPRGRSMRINKLSVGLTAALTALVATSALAQTKWDMPTPYSDGTFHTKNARQFAEEVAKGGKLQMTVHSNASLIK